MVATVGFDAGDDSETKCITQNTSGCGAGCSQSACQDSGRSSCVTDQAAESCSDRKESDSTTRWGIETVCVKCKATTAQVLAKQQESLCWDCFHASLGKTVRKAVRLRGLVQPGDKVLVAVSGGHASTVLLRLLNEMRNLNMVREERGQIAFQMGAVYVGEGLANGSSPEESRRAMEAVSALHQASAPDVPLHCVLLEDIFDAEDERLADMGMDKGGLLVNLLQAVEDVTGREDLIESLRNALMVRVAARLGYNKLARGDCATRVAVRTIASAAKGAGFALPASIQHFDGRAGKEGPAVICPVRDLPMKDLAMLCHHLGAAPVLPPRPPQRARRKASLNTLAEGFVAGLQSALPSTVPTIVRTALKLQAFPWNQPSTTLGRGKDQNGASPADPAPASLCSICCAPLSPTEITAMQGVGGNTHGGGGIQLMNAVQEKIEGAANTSTPVGSRVRSSTGRGEYAVSKNGNTTVPDLCRVDGNPSVGSNGQATAAAKYPFQAGSHDHAQWFASRKYCLVCQQQILACLHSNKSILELLPCSMRKDISREDDDRRRCEDFSAFCIL